MSVPKKRPPMKKKRSTEQARKSSTIKANKPGASKKAKRRRPPSSKRKNEQRSKQSTYLRKAQRIGRKVLMVSEHAFFVLFVISWIWIFFTFGSHRISGSSMEPTLTNGERIVFHRTQSPERNDIITFIPTDEPDSNYVKRVVGMPGDAFYLQGEHLYLFPAGTEFNSTEELTTSGSLPDSTIVLFLNEEVANELRGQTEIPADQYFVVGDNRRNSVDSRSFSFVKKEQIEGVMTMRLYPFSKIGVVH